MELNVIASGSKGNCYLLHNDNEALMIEAGVPPTKVLHALKSKFRTLQGCIITHEHKDHAKYVKDVLSYGLPVYMTKGTAIATNVNHPMVKTFEGDENKIVYDPVFIGKFVVRAFRTEHDACEPCGFVIQHEDFGSLLFATDTHYLAPRFSGLSFIMIECNYDEQLLKKRNIPEELKERIRGSHMSVDTCIDTLNANDINHVLSTILIHISEGDGDPEMFVERVKKETRLPWVYAAEQGLKLQINNPPF